MAHLACLDHKKRVLVTDRFVIHRSDGTNCDNSILKIGTQYYSHFEIALLIPAVNLKTAELKEN